LCQEIIRQYLPTILERVEIHKAGGYPYVVQVLQHHNTNPAYKGRKAVAIIDGDNPPLPKPDYSVLKLPDGAPEALVYEYIHNSAEEVVSLIQQRCQCPSVSQDKIVAAIRSVYADTTDHHLYFSKLGEKLGFISELIIRRGLSSIYVQNSSDELSSLVGFMKERLE